VQRGAVIYEERKADTSDVEQLHAADATTSDLLVGIFSDVSRDDSTRQSDPEATNDSTDIQLREIVASSQSACGLDDAADDENKICQKERISSTELVGEVKGRHGAKEASCLEDRDDVSFQRGMVGTFFIEAKAVVERVHGEYSADETSIPTEQHATETGDCCEEVSATVLHHVAPYLRHAGALHGDQEVMGRFMSFSRSRDPSFGVQDSPRKCWRGVGVA
jgi:hypothetical protein